MSEYYNWYVNDLLAEHVRNAAAGLTGDLVVDLGCGQQPYREYFAGFVRYLGLDRPGMPDTGEVVDVFADAADLPLTSSIADAVICTEVMEHVPDPRRMLADVHRVLRPGGALVLSVPFTWHIHDEPYDYWRFTEYGLHRILEESGFEVEDLRAVNGYLGANLQSQCYVLLATGRLRPLFRPLIWGLQRLAKSLRRFDRNSRATSNYVVRARKAP